MESLPLLSRPDKGNGVSKWPFIAAGIIFFGLLAIGNYFVDRSVSTEPNIFTRSAARPLEVALDVSKTAAVPSTWAIYFDPTLMVLPNERSYSKAYLLQNPVPQTPTFDLAIQSYPYQFNRPYFRANTAMAPTKAGSWSKQSPILMVETSVPSASEMSPISVVSLFGELHNRPLLSLPEFPRIVHTELLMPTEISIGVDASGGVKMVMLDKSCGDDHIDELGLKLARSISFLPSAQQEDRLSWGQLKISWVVDLKSPRP